VHGGEEKLDETPQAATREKDGVDFCGEKEGTVVT